MPFPYACCAISNTDVARVVLSRFKKQQFGLAKKNYADAIELLDMCALSTVDDDAVKAACLLNLA
eukprot:1975505-Rhodomonas_salina.1